MIFISDNFEKQNSDPFLNMSESYHERYDNLQPERKKKEATLRSRKITLQFCKPNYEALGIIIREKTVIQ